MDPFDLSWGQRAHFDHLIRNGLAAGGTPLTGVWRFPDPVRAESVVGALKLLVQRHDALRTSYLPDPGKHGSWLPGRVLQQVFPERPLTIRMVDCRSGELAGRCAVAVTRNQWPAFDPREVSALPVTLFQTTRGIEAVAVSVPHHAVDLRGFQTLGDEFQLAVDSGSSGPFPPAWQPRQQVSVESRQRRTSAELPTHEYLETALAMTPPVFLTARRPRDQWRTSSARVVSAALASRVAGLARANRCSASSVMSTLVMALLAAHTGEHAVLVRSSYPRRPPHRKSYIAPRTLTALVHLEIPTRCTVAELLELGRRSTIRGYSNVNCDPATLSALEIEHSHVTGGPLDGFCGFDFGRPPAERGMLGGIPWGLGPAGVVGAGQRQPSQIVMTVEEGVVLPRPMRFVFACSRARGSGAMVVELLTDNELTGVPAGLFIERLMRFADFAAEHPASSLRDAARLR